MYEPDDSENIYGGAGLPSLTLVSDTGSTSETIGSCPGDSLPDTSVVTDELAQAGPGTGNDSVPSTELGGQDPPVWIKYTNAANGVDDSLLDNPRTGAAWSATEEPTDMAPSGGFWENVDNNYVLTTDTSAYGDILVFHAKAPTTPDTYFPPGNATMVSADMRYWSMCSNDSGSQFLACVRDDQVSLDQNGYYTIVVSTTANDPMSGLHCPAGIEWLPKGPTPSTTMILRNMLPGPSFVQAIQDIPHQGDEQPTMGPYYPQGYYFDHASDFESFVNSNCDASGDFQWPSTPPTSYHPAS